MTPNYMLAQMQTFPALLKEVFPELQRETNAFLEESLLKTIKTIYIYGSGDSYNAAVGAAFAIAQYAKIPVVPLPALQASRYLSKTLTAEQAAESLTIGVSNSGEASRTVEATMALTKAGCHTVAMTANPQSRIGKSARHIFQVRIPATDPTPVPVPGVRSFVVPHLALFLLGLAIGKRLHRLSLEEYDALCGQLERLPSILEQGFQAHHETMAQFAAFASETKRMELMGAGPCRGACDFGVSKVLEGYGYQASSQDLEEFAHQTFFSNQLETLPTVMTMTTTGNSHQRELEILQVLTRQGRPTLVLTDDVDFVAPAKSVVAIKLSEPVNEAFIPLVYASLISYTISLMEHEEGDIYMHGHQGAYNEVGLPTVRDSVIVED